MISKYGNYYWKYEYINKFLHRLVIENARLNDEILKFKDYKPEEPNEVLKRRLKNAEKELQGKDHLIFSLQEKVA